LETDDHEMLWSWALLSRNILCLRAARGTKMETPFYRYRYSAGGTSGLAMCAVPLSRLTSRFSARGEFGPSLEVAALDGKLSFLF